MESFSTNGYGARPDFHGSLPAWSSTIALWLSLFFSEVSMLADIGRFAQASLPEK
jgi:hypothetical protein